LVIVVDSISFQLPIIQLPISALRGRLLVAEEQPFDAAGGRRGVHLTGELKLCQLVDVICDCGRWSMHTWRMEESDRERDLAGAGRVLDLTCQEHGFGCACGEAVGALEPAEFVGVGGGLLDAVQGPAGPCLGRIGGELAFEDEVGCVEEGEVGEVGWGEQLVGFLVEEGEGEQGLEGDVEAVGGQGFVAGGRRGGCVGLGELAGEVAVVVGAGYVGYGQAAFDFV